MENILITGGLLYKIQFSKMESYNKIDKVLTVGPILAIRTLIVIAAYVIMMLKTGEKFTIGENIWIKFYKEVVKDNILLIITFILH